MEGITTPARLKPANADDTLDSLRFYFSDGNTCLVTPSMRRLEGARVALSVTYSYDRKFSDEDRRDVTEYVEKKMRSKAEAKVETIGANAETEAMGAAAEWLAQRSQVRGKLSR